ncbi:hypothetical protein A4D02_16905 [Niastella koreensis]|uniref:Uncharacterized protein n=2 Tax=Niastella koreensis TaxID=354356 RepID=G8TFA2_NIAKG|nr:hypothetical protein [Niastella koreensis]AEV97312.1 hypothetical protein Niako_0933 [Niastella koreensis GR20-10]OQP39018.1 hypothetical protein A4D02_16905 [Niastella koreensis]
MKTVLIAICALGLTLSASAQKVVRVAPHPRTHVSVGVGLGYGYGYGYYPYSPFYNPWYAYPPGYGYGYGYRSRPTKLDLQIQDINNDYKDKIWSARHDESLSRKQRRQEVHDLKHQRDNDILQAKKDYYKR